MTILNSDFHRRGYLTLSGVLDEARLNETRLKLEGELSPRAGDRRLLDYEWCRDLANLINRHLVSAQVTTDSYVATLCTYFNKSSESNWGVASHRDLSVPVKIRFEKPDWKNWTDKQRIPHVQPPVTFLRGMFAIRLNIDPSTPDNGALIVSPSSHTSESAEKPTVLIKGAPGSALMMSPLLLHASRRSRTDAKRRVLHFLFGPAAPSPPVEWFYSA